MKNSYGPTLVILAMLFVALNAATTRGQMKAAGEVVELINGKTAIVAVAGGRITVELQYIDVPEPEQALHSVVKDHVSALLLGRTVEVETRGMTRGKVVGKLLLNGLDVCLQMLRDGAAWHLPIEMSGQSAAEFDLYAKSVALARHEKRGVWAVDGLKAPWAVRAERDEMHRQASVTARRGKPVKVGVSPYQTDTRPTSTKANPSATPSRRAQMDAWVSVFARTGKEPYGLQTYKDPKGRFNVVYTSQALVEFSGAQGRETLECRAMYVTVNSSKGADTSFYLIAFRAIADDYRFSKTKTRMIARIDNQSLSLGSPFGIRGQGLIGLGGIGSEELMYFKTSSSTLRKIGNAKTVEFSINKLSAAISPDACDLFWQLAVATD